MHSKKTVVDSLDIAYELMLEAPIRSDTVLEFIAWRKKNHLLGD